MEGADMATICPAQIINPITQKIEVMMGRFRAAFAMFFYLFAKGFMRSIEWLLPGPVVRLNKQE
jgi:hypothetical protein